MSAAGFQPDRGRKPAAEGAHKPPPLYDTFPSTYEVGWVTTVVYMCPFCPRKLRFAVLCLPSQQEKGLAEHLAEHVEEMSS